MKGRVVHCEVVFPLMYFENRVHDILKVVFCCML